MEGNIKDLLERRRNRAMAAVLGFKDREVDHHLPADTAAAFRKVILDQLNEYHTVVVDILDSVTDTDGTILNEIFYEKFEQLHENVERLVASLET